jgi:hypothetical protein
MSIPFHPAQAGTGPRSLADLDKGKTISGDCGNSPKSLPAWMMDEDSKERYTRVYKYFEHHAITLSISWHMSLTIGFSLPNLLGALVWTGDSDTPAKALERYMDTAKHLVEW